MNKILSPKVFLAITGMVFIVVITAFFFTRGTDRCVIASEFFERNNINSQDIHGAALSGLELSSTELKQGDTFIVTLKDTAEPAQVRGYLGCQPLTVFLTNKGILLALAGIGVTEMPGYHELTITSGEKTAHKTVRVLQRSFPITALPEFKGYTIKNVLLNILAYDNPTIRPILEMRDTKVHFGDSFIYPLTSFITVPNEARYGTIMNGEILWRQVSIRHLGVDLIARPGAPIYAVNSGIVAFVGELRNYGKTVIIDHGGGIRSVYLHLDRFDVLRGDTVRQGDIVGSVGNTGYSSIPHLHFAIRVNGGSVNPLKFIVTTQEAMGMAPWAVKHRCRLQPYHERSFNIIYNGAPAVLGSYSVCVEE